MCHTKDNLHTFNTIQGFLNIIQSDVPATESRRITDTKKICI